MYNEKEDKNMVIIFLDNITNKLYIATDSEPIKTIPLGDVKLLDSIPDDDLIYVQSAHIITKEQFKAWLNGEYELVHDASVVPSPGTSVRDQQVINYESTPRKKNYYLHTVVDAPMVLGDIRTARFPEGVLIQGKYSFVPLDLIGEDNLERSAHYKIALRNRRIEIVDDDYVQKNSHKSTPRGGFRDSELDRILLPPGTDSHSVAADGGLAYDDSDLYQPTQPLYRGQPVDPRIPQNYLPQYPQQGIPRTGSVPLYRDR